MAQYLTNSDIAELVSFRRKLHRHPELSGEEHETALRVIEFLKPLNPDAVHAGLGGTGVAVVFEGREPGPTVMIRAELDGLPIEEISEAPHRSQIAGTGHLCGHDGHMVMLCAVARHLARNRPARGRAVLLFQPAEETGKGAEAVLNDPVFAALTPDYAFSLHNLPGMPLGKVALQAGPANCASRGMRIELTGKTAHASMPETGVSPALALAELIPALAALGTGGALQPGFRLVTLTHVSMGAAAFGVAPGQAEIWATLRCLQDGEMASLCAEAEELVQASAKQHGLHAVWDYDDVFHHCDNDTEATDILLKATKAVGIACDQTLGPMRWSEDFGRFGATAKAAMFLLGAGRDHPQLHNPDYDFPDDLIPVGASVFLAAIDQVLNMGRDAA